MTTRAVYLELGTDGSKDTFLMAFRRFAILRGYPSNCWSDRGTNFFFRTKVFGGNIARLGHPLSSKCLVRRIFMFFSLRVEHTTSQPSKRSGRKSHHMSKTSLRRFIKEPNPHRGTLEKVSGRSNLFDQWTSPLS